MSFEIDFMGLKLKNPLIVAAGPWSGKGELIKKAFECGAGAVVTETVVNEVNPNFFPRIAYDGKGVQNIRLYSDIPLEKWDKEIEIAKKGGGPVIVSICADTPSELKYIGKKLEKMGADGLEIGRAAPMGEGLEVPASNPAHVFEFTKAVTESVKIPVMVKLSQNSNVSKAAAAAETAGAAAVCAIDTVRCILGVDIRRRQPLLPTYGGYSGGPIRPLGLASVAAIAQSVKIPVCGIGGIERGDHALEYIMLGASAVQIGTSLMINGLEYIEKISRRFDEIVEQEGIRNLEEIRGAALKEIRSFEEIQKNPKAAFLRESCKDENCSDCIKSCVYQAIIRKGKEIMIDQGGCKGCGLCGCVCPQGKIEMKII